MKRVRKLGVQRFSTTSPKDFPEVVADLESVLGRCDLAEFHRAVSSSGGQAELERIVLEAAGSSGFIEFARFELGAVLRKRIGDQAPRMVRILLGNPLWMAQIARHVADAGSYVPVSVLIDERADGVHLSFDRLASLIAPYGSAEALRAAQELDAKVEGLLTSAAQGGTVPRRKTA
jgi:uncharacterized protein (DUF302 family)